MPSQLVTDLTPYGGQEVTLECFFDTVDSMGNGGPGDVIDDLRIEDPCPRGCFRSATCRLRRPSTMAGTPIWIMAVSKHYPYSIHRALRGGD